MSWPQALCLLMTTGRCVLMPKTPNSNRDDGNSEATFACHWQCHWQLVAPATGNAMHSLRSYSKPSIHPHTIDAAPRASAQGACEQIDAVVSRFGVWPRQLQGNSITHNTAQQGTPHTHS
jgi:hypothetical protein